MLDKYQKTPKNTKRPKNITARRTRAHARTRSLARSLTHSLARSLCPSLPRSRTRFFCSRAAFIFVEVWRGVCADGRYGSPDGYLRVAGPLPLLLLVALVVLAVSLAEGERGWSPGDRCYYF